MLREVRDSQRSKVYKAEKVLLPLAAPLREVKDVECFIKKQMARKAITRRYPSATRATEVKDGRGRRHACAFGGYAISLPIWARNEAIVIHEMAHIVTNRHYGERGLASHGWQFCAVFLDLVRFIMGNEAHDALKVSFKANKVRFTKPRTRKPLSPERRAALAERLAAARAARIEGVAA